MGDAMQSRIGRDPDDGVGRAERRHGCDEHDPGDDEQDDAAECARAEESTPRDGGRRDGERPKSPISRRLKYTMCAICSPLSASSYSFGRRQRTSSTRTRG
jgi:hypothetical protein